MNQNLKYSIGIDISKESFDVCISVINSCQEVRVIASRKFMNQKKGFNEFILWIKKHCKEEIPVRTTMEATGVYYEGLAISLTDKGYYLSVVLPNKAKKYIQSKGTKTKNDKIDAKGLSQMGAEQNLLSWKPFSKTMYQLRSLTRHNEDLQNQRTGIKNRIEAYNYSSYKNDVILNQYMNLLNLIDEQIKMVNDEILKSLDMDDDLKSKVEKICKIKGLGVLTVVTIIAETNGFELIQNQKQLSSYSGYDIIENQSGKRTGRTKISKKGNSHIRRSLHMPAFNVVRYEQAGFKALYERIYGRTGCKMKAYVAVQRKLLLLIYALWKKDEDYNPNYLKTEQGKTSGDEESKLLFSLNFEEVVKKIGGIKPPTQDKLPSDESSEVLLSLMQSS